MNIHLKPTPRTPGAWMRIKLVKRYLLTIVVASLGLGAIILWLALTTIPGPASMIVNATLLVWMVGVAASLLFAKYGFKNYRSSYLEKGLAAETLIGRRIEAAITIPNYAVAHNVQIEAETQSGDIDHLVATPEGIVVVESKFKDLPPNKFKKARNRLAGAIKEVRAWAPKGTSVRGAIVFMHLSHEEREYPTQGEDIRVYESENFTKEIRSKIAVEPTLPHVGMVRKAGLPE